MSKYCWEKGDSVHDSSWPLSAIETFRFYGEDYEYEIFSMLSRSRASTSVILVGNRDSHGHSLHDFQLECRSDGNKLSNDRSFIILQSGAGLNPFNKDNSAKICGEKEKDNEAFLGVYLLRIREKA